MARFVKNDVNFHGARSKTRVVENSSFKKQDSQTSNKSFMSKNDDGAWGSVPNSSSSASDWDDGWGDVANNNNSVSDDSWGQDKQVHGKAERNRRHRSFGKNNSFRVPIQSLPDWDHVDEEFPTLGSSKPPVANVWEKRKQQFEEKASIVPTSLSEEEKMIQHAIELSKMESRQEEERRWQLEEEYKLQTQLLEANPDQFCEFRLDSNDFRATSAQSHENINGNSEEFPGDEIPESVDCESGWEYTSTKVSKEKSNKKEKKEKETPKQEDNFPQLKDKPVLPPICTNKGTKSKIAKVIDMFGGWGDTTFSTQDTFQEKSASKSDNWETVDTKFVSKTSKRNTIEDKPDNKPSTPAILEVKLENTSNWDTVDTIDFKSGSDSVSEKAPLQDGQWLEDGNQVADRNYLGTRDVVELNLKDCGPGYALNQKDQEFATQSQRKNDKPKAELKSGLKEKMPVSVKDGKETGSCFEEEESAELNNEFKSGKDQHRNQINSSDQSQDISPGGNIGAKHEVGSLEDTYSDSHQSVENNFLLSNIDNPRTRTQLKDSKQKQVIQTDKNSSISSKNGQAEFSQVPNTTASTFGLEYFLSELSVSKDPSISEPKALKNETQSSSNSILDLTNNGPCKTNDMNTLYDVETDSSIPFFMPDADHKDAQPSLIFDGFPTNAENLGLSLGNENICIEPPKASVAMPEFINPAFLPQPSPMMTPFANPALMMGMNPMLMQQMMMLSNPFFVQQLQQMDMYYKTLGMPHMGGMPIFPQPMSIPHFQNPNLQAFNNSMHSVPDPTEESETIPSPVQTPGSQLSGTDSRQLLDDVPPEANQPETDSFWFQDYMSTDTSPSFIPPPKPTPGNAPANPAEASQEASAIAFPTVPSNAQNTGNEGLPTSRNATPISDQQFYNCSNGSHEVPYATGWGDIDEGSKSSTACSDNAAGWGDDNPAIAKSMRNSSRHVPETKAACRQPASRPYLGRPKA